MSNCIYTYNGKSYNEEDFKEFINKNLISIIYELKDSDNLSNLIDPAFEVMKSDEHSWVNVIFNKFYPKELKDRLHFLYAVVNSDSFGIWNKSGMTLYANAATGTGYHEAWHEFSQMFLTKEEKKSLYTEAIANIKELSGLDINDIDDVKKVEEYLADDFMRYMLSDGKEILKGNPTRNTIFRKIINFIKALFGHKNFEGRVAELYNNLRTGNLSRYSFNIDNSYFEGGLNRIIPNIEKLEAAKSDISGAIDGILDTFDAYISHIAKQKGINVIELFRNKELILNIYKEVEKQVEFLSKDAELSKDNRDLWKFVHKNFWKEFVAAHRERGTWSTGSMTRKKEKELTDMIESIINKKNEDDEENEGLGEQEVTAKREEHNKAGNEKTSFEEASKEIKFLVKSLIKKERLDPIDSESNIHRIFLENTTLQSIGSKELYEEYLRNTDNSSFTKEEDEKAFENFVVNYKYPAVPNKYGGIQLVDFETTWNLIQKELSGLTTYEDMYRKLTLLSKSNIDLIDLVKSLPNTNMGQLSTDSLHIAARFKTDFTRVSIPIKINSTVIERDSEGSIINIDIRNVLASNIAIGAVKEKFQLKWEQNTDSPYIIIDKDENKFLNINKVNEDFLTPTVTIEEEDEDGKITYTKIENEKYVYSNAVFTKDKENAVFNNRVEFLKALGFMFHEDVVNAQDFRDSIMGYSTSEDVFMPGIFSGSHYNNVGSMLVSDLKKVQAVNEKELKIQKDLSKEEKERLKVSGVKYKISNPIDFFSKPLDLYVTNQNKPADTLNGSSENINRKLIDMEILHSGEYFNNASFNADGKIQNENSQFNAITTYITDLNNFEKYPTYQSLISNPELQQFDINKNPDIRSSLLMNSLFNLNTESNSFGERKRDTTKKSTKSGEKPFVKLEISNYNGMQISDKKNSTNEGGTTVKLSKLDRYITTISNILNDGVSELMRAGTKSTALSVRPSFMYIYNKSRANHKNYFNLSSDLTNESFENITININLADKLETEKLNEIFYKYLLSELERMYKSRKLIKDEKNIIVGEKESFSIFEGLLDANTKKDILSKLTKLANKKGNPISYSVLVEHFNELVLEKGSVNTLKKDILGSIGSYLEKQVSGYEKILKKAGYSKTGNSGLGEIVLKNNKGTLDSTIIRSYIINQFVYNVETSKVLFGNPSFYKAWNKRLGSFLSTGNMPDTSNWMNNQIQNTENYRLEAKLSENKVRPMDGEVHSTVYDDIIIDVPKEVRSTYEKLFESQNISKEEIDELISNLDKANEPDGIAMMSFDFYRIFKMSIGFWYDAHETAYKKLLNWDKKKKELGELKDTTSDEYYELEKEVKNLSPTLSDVALFPMIKIGQAGPIKNNDFYLPSVFKGAMYPILPGMASENSNIYNVRERMLKNGDDYVTFKSTSKVVTVGKKGELGQFYKDVDSRELNTDEQHKTITYLKYYKEQLQIEPHSDTNNSLGTQIRKQLFGNKFNSGVPIDFKLEGVKYISKKRNLWDALSEEEKLKSSNLYALNESYKKALDEIRKYKQEELLEELGVEGYVDGKPETIKIKDYKKFVDLVIKETLKKEAPNSIEYFLRLNKNGGLQYSLEASKDKQLIQEILMSIVNNRLVDVKMNGSALFQMPETGFETTLKGTTKKYDNTLKAYGIKRHPDGTIKSIGLETMISFSDNYKPLLRLEHPDGKTIKTLDRLNEAMRDEDWYSQNEDKLKIFGYRIPSQNMSSAAHFRIKQFLSPETMNVIVLPSIITKINGSDFDIDKLYMIHPFFSGLGKILTINDRVSKKEALVNIEKIKAEKANLKKPNFIKSVEEIAGLIKSGDMLRGDNKISLIYNLKYLTEELYRKEIRLDEIMSTVSEDTMLEKTLSSKELNKEIDYLNTLINDLTGVAEQYKLFTDSGKKAIAEDISKIAKEGFAYFNRLNALNDRLDYEYAMANNQEKVLGNSVYNIAMNIMQMEGSFKDIITANNSNKLEEITKFIKENDKDNDYNEEPSKTDLMSPVYGAEVYSSFMESKDALGIAALASPLHQMLQRAGAYLSNTFTFNGESYPTTVWLKNNKINVNGKVYINMSSDLSVNDYSISRGLSEFITAYVDAENNPFIFYMNGGKKLAPVLLYLTHQGVTLENAVYLVNQDSVKQYISKLAYSESSIGKYIKEKQKDSYEHIHALVETYNNFAPEGVSKLNIESYEQPSSNGTMFYNKANFYKDLKGVVEKINAEEAENFLKEEVLKKRIEGTNMLEEGTQEEKEEANKKVSFYSFVQYVMLEMQSADLREVNDNLKFDTKKIKSVGLSIYKQNKLDDLIYGSVEKGKKDIDTHILPSKVIGEIAYNSEISPYRVYPVINNLFRDVERIQSNPKIQNMLKSLLDETKTTKSDYKIERLVKEYYNDLILFLIQNKGSLVGDTYVKDVDDYIDLILKDGEGTTRNIVDTFMDLRKKYNGENHEYNIMDEDFGSVIFRSLGVFDSKKSNLKTLKWKDKRINTSVVNSLMSEWRQMANTKKTEFLDIKNFFRNELPKATFLSYGELRSMKSFVSLIPVEIHAEWITPYIKYFFDNIDENSKNFKDPAFNAKLEKFNDLFKSNHPNFFKSKKTKVSDDRFVDYSLNEKAKFSPILKFETQVEESDGNEVMDEPIKTEVPVTIKITKTEEEPKDTIPEKVEPLPEIDRTHVPSKINKNSIKFYSIGINNINGKETAFERYGKRVTVPTFKDIDMMMEQGTKILYELSTGLSVTTMGITEKDILDHAKDLFKRENIRDIIKNAKKTALNTGQGIKKATKEVIEKAPVEQPINKEIKSSELLNKVGDVIIQTSKLKYKTVELKGIIENIDKTENGYEITLKFKTYKGNRIEKVIIEDGKVIKTIYKSPLEMGKLVESNKGVYNFEFQNQPTEIKSKTEDSKKLEEFGQLSMTSDHISQIKNSKKVILNKTSSYKDGVYTLSGGTKVELRYIGMVSFNPSTEVLTINDQVFKKDEYAKAEGYKDWDDFEENSIESKKLTNGEQKRFAYEVSIVEDQPEFNKYSGTMQESEFNSLSLQVQQEMVAQQKTC